MIGEIYFRFNDAEFIYECKVRDIAQVIALIGGLSTSLISALCFFMEGIQNFNLKVIMIGTLYRVKSD